MIRRHPEIAPPSDDYIRFDQFEDVIASVELVALVAPLPGDNSLRCKWMIIGAHSALQGAMVCALFDLMSVLAKASKKNKKAAQQAANLNVPQELIENRLAKFDDLLKRCIKGNQFCQPLVLTPPQRKNITRLNREFRNNFLHFSLQGWSIEKAVLALIICAALDAVEMLMSREQVINRLGDGQQDRLTKALQTARAAVGS
jgi:hypothetical protein